jgi:hypothetical protein
MSINEPLRIKQLSLNTRGSKRGNSAQRSSRQDRSPQDIFVILCVAMLVLFHVYVFAYYFYWRYNSSPSILGTDLRAFYTSWKIVLQGNAHHLYDLDLQARIQSPIVGYQLDTNTLLAYVNPPFASLPLVWLAFFTVPMAYAIFAGIQVLSLAAACRSIIREQLSAWSTVGQVAFLASGVLSVATLTAVTLGTFTPLMLLAVVRIASEYRTSIRAQTQLRTHHVGIWLCILAIKPQLALFVLVSLVVTRQWKPLCSAGIAGTLIVLVCSIVSGPTIWLHYLRTLVTYGSSNGKFGGDSRYMWNLRGAISRINGVSLIQADRVSTVLFALGLVCCGVIVRRWWKHAERSSYAEVFERTTVLTMCFTVLLTPHCNRQDTLLLLPAVVSMINLRRASPIRTGYDWVPAMAAILSAVALLWGNDPAGFPLHPITLMALILTVLALRTRKRFANDGAADLPRES